MAVTLLSNLRRAKIDALELDASLSETHASDVDVTEHPVEQGANISDHARKLPHKLTLEGIVTNTPIGVGAVPGNQRAETAYRQLLELEGKLITVVTTLRTYTDVTITSLVVPRNAELGDSVRFTAVLKQVTVAKSKTVAVLTSTTRGRPKANQGKQATNAAGEATVQKSILKKASETGTGKRLLKAMGWD